jgi:beta-lactamase regulating signal transducer with metallopeptidase domain
VTRGLLARLDEEELRAALMHEVEHARARGPLKVALAHLAARAFFWLPALGDLLDRFILLSELAADRAAIRVTSRSALAGALSEVIEAPHPLAAVALADFAAPRIDRLFDESAELPPIFRRSSLLAGVGAIGTVAFVLACSPHLGLGESTQLHAMTVNLLAHRLHARLIGFGETAAAIAVCVTAWRRFATR